MNVGHALIDTAALSVMDQSIQVYNGTQYTAAALSALSISRVAAVM